MTSADPIRPARIRRRGNAMVEFAMSVSLLFPMFVGTFQFGYAFFHYNRLISLVRAGARYGAIRTYDSSTSTPTSAYVTSVRNVVVYGSPNGGTTSLISGLTTDAVNISVTMAGGTPDMITVTISDFSLDAVVKSLRWSNKPSASFRFEGRYAPQ
jgi:Flp pilus assembly protein TadG